MPVGAIVGSIGSGLISAWGSSNAADKMSAAQMQALALQRQMFDTSQKNFSPFIKTGQSSTLSLAQLYGLDPTGKTGGNIANMYGPEALSKFEASPDYRFALDQGMNALTFSNSAQGLLQSRGHLNDTVKFGQGMATQNFGNYVARLLQLSQLGAGSAASAAGNATAQGGILGNTMSGIGQSQAAGVMGATNGLNNAFTGGMNNLAMYNMINGGGGSYFPSGGGNNGTGYLPIGTNYMMPTNLGYS
jgi:hypothetical protein